MILGTLTVMVILASVTKSWWFPEGLRDRWHAAWVSYPAKEDSPRAALLSEHAQQMAELEKSFREMITAEKNKHTGLLAEKARLSETPEIP